jgi:hypothetical protein
MDGRQAGVHEGVEILVLDRAQMHQARALVGPQPPVDDMGPAVHDHLVTALGQPRGELLDGGLEAGVGSGDPARTEDGDLHDMVGSVGMVQGERVCGQVDARGITPRESLGAP